MVAARPKRIRDSMRKGVVRRGFTTPFKWAFKSMTITFRSALKGNAKRDSGGAAANKSSLLSPFSLTPPPATNLLPMKVSPSEFVVTSTDLVPIGGFSVSF